MATITTPNIGNGDLPMFLSSGKFSDFELRHTEYTFNVHKIVICGKSLYFEKLCGENFKEGKQGYSTLDEEDEPAMIARMLLAMYSGDYTSANAEQVLGRILHNASTHHESTQSLRFDINPKTYITHARMYAMGDKYQFAALVELARSNFVAALSAANFSLEDLVAAIDIVYSTTIDSDYGLRKYVVFRAQSQIHQLKQMRAFKEVFERYVGFGWDMATEYKARKTVWCIGCEHDSKLPVVCTCGFQGICGGLKACKELDWMSLKCSHCKLVGQIVREKPRDDDEVIIVLPPKAQSAPTSPSTTEPIATRSNKRKSM